MKSSLIKTLADWESKGLRFCVYNARGLECCGKILATTRNSDMLVSESEMFDFEGTDIASLIDKIFGEALLEGSTFEGNTLDEIIEETGGSIDVSDGYLLVDPKNAIKGIYNSTDRLPDDLRFQWDARIVENMEFFKSITREDLSLNEDFYESVESAMRVVMAESDRSDDGFYTFYELENCVKSIENLFEDGVDFEDEICAAISLSLADLCEFEVYTASSDWRYYFEFGNSHTVFVQNNEGVLEVIAASGSEV